jgi:hypothetical protein
MKLSRTAAVYLLGVATMLMVAQSYAQKKPTAGLQAIIAHGKMLVTLGGCNDCHSPKIMTAQGPVPDTTRLLSGSPSGWTVAPVPREALAMDKWAYVASGDLTAWAGPWGVSFARNLTPDKETGLGSWTANMFIKAMRTGKDMGEGRPILPPMPWQFFGQLPDSELKAIFAYLHSLKPIKNQVHDPIPPPGPPSGMQH